MPDPKRDSYAECEPCSQAEGEPVVYHRSQLKLHQPFFGGESYYVCPNGHKLAWTPPAPKPQAGAS